MYLEADALQMAFSLQLCSGAQSLQIGASMVEDPLGILHSEDMWNDASTIYACQ